MSLPKYPAYKPSGVESIGSVPAHWALTKVKRVLASLGSGGTPDTDNQQYWADGDGVPWVAIGDMSDRDYVYGTAKSLTPEGIKSKALTIWPEGTLLFSMYASLGHVAELKTPAATNQAILSLVPIGSISQGFLKRWFEYIRPGLREHASSNTQDNLNAEKVRNLFVVCPPPPESAAISTFLDHETAKIDALVDEQQRLIELLKEKRQAVVSQAVTKGLDPNVPMKDSGVEWLGKVPAHWKVLRVKDIARLESGHTPSKTVPEYWENCTIPWVSLNDSKQLAVSDYIAETAVQINELGLANSSARMLPAGAVVFTRDATIGLAAITTRSMAVSQHLIAWCPGHDIDALYLLRVFDVMKRFLDSATFGATIKTIGMADVKKLVTPVPPRAEQLEIAAAVGRMFDGIDALVHDAELSVDLLLERRAAMISAAVTGKIDVRGLVPQSEAVAA